MVYETTSNLITVEAAQETPWPFTVADGTTITKGQLLKLTTDRTAILSTAVNDKIAGIAGRDKVADDGRTELAVHRRCMAMCYCSGVINVGDPIMAAATNTYPNFVRGVNDLITASGANIIGHALQAGTNGQRKLMWIDIGAGSGAVS